MKNKLALTLTLKIITQLVNTLMIILLVKHVISSQIYAKSMGNQDADVIMGIFLMVIAASMGLFGLVRFMFNYRGGDNFTELIIMSSKTIIAGLFIGVIAGVETNYVAFNLIMLILILSLLLHEISKFLIKRFILSYHKHFLVDEEYYILKDSDTNEITFEDARMVVNKLDRTANPVLKVDVYFNAIPYVLKIPLADFSYNKSKRGVIINVK